MGSRPSPSSWIAAALATALSLAAAVAVAQPSAAGASSPTATPDVESARQHFRKGNTFFDLQRFIEAAHEYETAYEAKDDPALLFNIGQAYRLGGDYNKAIGAYRSYLRRQPQPRNRAEVEARIADLQKLVADQRRTHDAPPQGPDVGIQLPGTASSTSPPAEPARSTPTPPEPVAPVAVTAPPLDASSGRSRRLIGIGLLAAGGAAIVAGATLTGLAYSTQHTYSQPTAMLAYDPSAASRMRTEQVAGGVLLGVGVGAAVGGTLLYLIGRRAGGHAERVALAPYVSQHATGLAVAGELP